MRVLHLLMTIGLILTLGACSGPKQNGAPPPVNRELLIGSWAAPEEGQLVRTVEFAADGSMKITFKNVPGEVAGKYAWSDDHSLAVEYQASAEAKKAYHATVKAMLEQIKELAKRMGKPAIEASAVEHYPEELPAQETMRVGLTADQLALTTQSGLALAFNRVK